jgi:hypothetical protein
MKRQQNEDEVEVEVEVEVDVEVDVEVEGDDLCLLCLLCLSCLLYCIDCIVLYIHLYISPMYLCFLLLPLIASSSSCLFLISSNLFFLNPN